MAQRARHWPLERIKRGLCEQLYSAKEVDELGISEDSSARLAEWQAVAGSFGWSVDLRGSKPIVDGTKRPRISEGITRLVTVEGSPIGDLLFSRLSAAAHVTWFGLEWAFDFSAARRDERSRFATVPFGTDAATVSALAFYSVRALRGAAITRVRFMGWRDVEWEEPVAGRPRSKTSFARPP